MKNLFLSRQQLASLARASNYRAGLLAQFLHMTPRTLERRFNAALRVPPQAWLDQARRRQIERLIRDGVKTGKIAKELGYRHSSSFCRRMKRDHGATVTVLKAKHFVAKC